MSTENTTRGARKVRKGVVVSKSGAKTVKVRVSYREIHPVYGKVVTRNKNYHVHDEADDAKVGDTVTIMETRPLSATKDNTGAKRAMCFRILGQRKEYAHLGDFIRVAIKEASPTGAVKKGSVATAVVIRTGNPIRRADGSSVRFDQNACVLLDSSKKNPIGSRVFGPVPRELREINKDNDAVHGLYMKILSLAPEVV